jgi:hypothetical protein
MALSDVFDFFLASQSREVYAGTVSEIGHDHLHILFQLIIPTFDAV